MKNRLEELRKERGIKQEETSVCFKSIKTDYWLIGEWQCQDPSILLAFRIARYFKMSIEEIFVYEEEEE